MGKKSPYLRAERDSFPMAAFPDSKKLDIGTDKFALFQKKDF